MHALDIGIIVGYLLLTLFVGLYQGRKVSSMKDYSIADRNYATPVMVAAMFATMIGGGSTLGISEKIFNGSLIFLLIIFSGTISLFITANFIAPRMKKFEGMISVGDMMEGSYGRSGRIITGIAGSLLMVGKLGSQISALGYVISFFFDTSFLWSTLLSCGIVVFYSTVGGIRAVTMTDVIQFGVLLVAIPMICNVSLNTVGGYKALFDGLPQSHMTPVPEGENLWKYLGFALVFMLPLMQPHVTQRFLMAKDTNQMRKVMNIAAASEIPFFLMVTVIGLSAVILFPDISGSHVIPTLISEVLPVGLKGMTIAGMMAVIMSTADSVLNTASISFVHDVLRPIFKEKITQKLELKITKIVSLVLGVSSIIMAISFESIFDIVFHSFQFWGPIVVVPLYAVIFDIKSNSRAFLKSVTAGTLSVICWKLFSLEKLFGFDALVPSMLANGLTFFMCVWLDRKKNRKVCKKYPKKNSLEKTNKAKNIAAWLAKRIKTLPTENFIDLLIHALGKRVEAVKPPYISFGMFALINYVVPHFMWDMSKPNNFILYFRSFAGVLAVTLILKNYWPLQSRKYRPLVWQATLFFCLPFLATYAALVNQGEIWWVVNLCLSIFILGTLTDWESFIWILGLGTGAGYFFALTQFPIVLTLSTEALYPSAYILFVSVIAGLLFSRRRERLQQERLKAVEAAGGAIAHEMRTPLSSIVMNSNLIQLSLNFLNKFSKNLTKEHQKKLNKHIHDLDLSSKALLTVSQESQNVINLLLTNLKQDFSDIPTEKLSMKKVIETTLHQFTFKGDESKNIKLSLQEDFEVNGNKELLIHVFFNLLKNSLYFIRSAQKGKIFITLKKTPSSYSVLFTDTGPGIPKDQLPKLFTPFYSKNPHGTGIGLSFCRKVLRSMKGNIKVESEFGEYTSFILEFPASNHSFLTPNK